MSHTFLEKLWLEFVVHLCNHIEQDAKKNSSFLARRKTVNDLSSNAGENTRAEGAAGKNEVHCMKKKHYTNRISACKGNMKESWKAINELLNKRSKSSSIDCLKESGTEILNKKDVSNAMNNYFCTIGSDLADKIQPAANPLLSGEFEVNKDRAKFRFKAIELKDIRDAFAKVKATKSFGVDNISSYFLKLALPYIVNSLIFLFNTSFDTSQFPDSWKVA